MEIYPKDNATEGFSELKKAWEAYDNGLYRRAANKAVSASFYLSEEIVQGDYTLLDDFHEAGMLGLIASALHAEYGFDSIDQFIVSDYIKLGFEAPIHALNDARESVINQIMSGPDPLLSAYTARKHADIIARSDPERAAALKSRIARTALELFAALPKDHLEYFLYEECARECRELLDELENT